MTRSTGDFKGTVMALGVLISLVAVLLASLPDMAHAFRAFLRAFQEDGLADGRVFFVVCLWSGFFWFGGLSMFEKK